MFFLFCIYFFFSSFEFRISVFSCLFQFCIYFATTVLLFHSCTMYTLYDCYFASLRIIWIILWDWNLCSGLNDRIMVYGSNDPHLVNADNMNSNMAWHTIPEYVWARETTDNFFFMSNRSYDFLKPISFELIQLKLWLNCRQKALIRDRRCRSEIWIPNGTNKKPKCMHFQK